MLYTYMEKLPSSINNNIFRFLSHPVADAIRDRISEFQDLNSQYESVSELHTSSVTRRSVDRSLLWMECTSDWGCAFA